MDHSKRRKLKSKGFKVGNVSELLGLTRAESDYAEFKLFLSRNLKFHRENKELTQTDFAKLIRSSQSRVAKMEACDPSVSIDLLIKSLMTLGISIKDLPFSSEKRTIQYEIPIETPITTVTAEAFAHVVSPQETPNATAENYFGLYGSAFH